MRAFFRWWLRQLVSLIPAGVRQSWPSSGRRISLEIEGETLVATLGKNGITRIPLDLTSAPAEESGSGPGLQSRLPAHLSSLHVHLAPREFLVRHFSLPSSARSHLVEAVGYQLSRLVPFSTAQVFYACGIEGESSDKTTINVWLVAIPRRKILTALRLLGMDATERPIAVPAPPAPGEPFDFLWHLTRNGEVARGRRRLLWGGALALWLFPLALHVNHQLTAYDTLSAHTQKLRSKAREVGELQEQVETIADRSEWLHQKKASAISILRVLDTLSRRLDERTWLQSLKIHGEKLVIQGFSPAPAGLIETLENTGALSEARFESAITQDARTGLDRFLISATLQTQEEAQ